MGAGKKRDVPFYRRLLERKSVQLRSCATRVPESAVALRKSAKACEKASGSLGLSLEHLRAISRAAGQQLRLAKLEEKGAFE